MKSALEQSLLVCCAAFHGVTAARAAERWPNLTLKKIPKMVLARCEWGHDDYSLNVANLPLAQPEKEQPSPAALFQRERESGSAYARSVWRCRGGGVMAKKPTARKPAKSGVMVQQPVGQMAGSSTGQGEFLLYQTEDAQTRVQVRFQDGGIWLTQAQLAELYQCSSQNITQHIRAIYESGELLEEATCKPYLQVRLERGRQVSRSLKHYSLEVVLAVGYRAKSHRGTQFRRWATEQLKTYLTKGVLLDDERFKRGKGADYFDELLARIRDIRSSERVFWRKVLDIYATSVDYDPRTETSQRFFATVQNKMHWAAHGHTAAEVICSGRMRTTEHGADELDGGPGADRFARPMWASPRTT